MWCKEVAVSKDVPVSTGDATVDEALARLTDLDGAPVREHLHVLEAVHDALQGRLADAEG
ncbi:MAG: hypothetical protein BGO37_03465 [Cellulomonas sp. 73-92]|nr:MAG: hypothetical protein BGO37_03465 [Cellulomonas sp. 73-92]